jgi:NNP family nitrate/nitrite transporter-like MFS transporter
MRTTTKGSSRARSGEWLESWDPENEETWDKSGLAWRTLWITTFCFTLAFVAWFLPSADHPQAQRARL